MLIVYLYVTFLLMSYFHIAVCKDILRPSFLILSFGTPKYVQRWKASILVRTCYAAIYNYTFILETIHDTGAWLNHHWIKPALILKYLPFYDYVFYLDLDIYIMNYKMPLKLFSDYHHSDVIVSDELKAPLLAGHLSHFINLNIVLFIYYLPFFFFCFTRYDNGSKFYARPKFCQEMDKLPTVMGA